MEDNIGSLWPTEIRPQIQSPLNILKAQAQALSQQTSGVLQAEISPVLTRRGEDKIIFSFDIVVPALDNYRRALFIVEQAKGLAYPATLEAEFFKNQRELDPFRGIEPGNKPDNRADNDQEFIQVLSTVLRSPQVVSLAQSLIASANEALSEKPLRQISRAPRKT